MKELTITAPAHLENELKETADLIGVSVEQLTALFFAAEVVHT